MQIRRTAAALTSAAALSLTGAAAMATPASAQPQQNGLINVNIEDNVVLIPIGVAANVCQVQVAVLAEIQPATFGDCDAAVMQDLPVAFQQ